MDYILVRDLDRFTVFVEDFGYAIFRLLYLLKKTKSIAIVCCLTRPSTNSRFLIVAFPYAMRKGPPLR